MTVVDDARAALERLIADRQAQINDRDDVQASLDTVLSANSALRSDLARLQAEFDAYKADHPADTPPPPDPDPPPPTSSPFSLWKPCLQVGMSSPKQTVNGNPEGLFESREADVEATGGQLLAMRVFAALDGDTQHDRISYAKTRGLIPVVTYKAAQSLSDAQFQALCVKERDWMRSQGVKAAVGYHHEPRPELTAAFYVHRTKLFGQVFRDPANFCRVTAMTAWILDASPAVKADFDNYMDPSLFVADSGGQVYIDAPGIDAYEEGDMANPAGSPSTGSAASRMEAFASWATSKGIGHLPLFVGEFNGYRGVSFDWVNDYMFGPKQGWKRFWLVMLWNSTAGKGITLTHDAASGDRLGHFQAFLKNATAKYV